MKKIIFVILTCAFFLWGCGSPEDNNEAETTAETSTEQSTQEETSTSPEYDILTVQDPSNDYPNNYLKFYFDGDVLESLALLLFLILWKKLFFGEDQYQMYEEEYESITLDETTLTVVYGENMRLEYSGYTKQSLEEYFVSQGYEIIN